MIASVSALKDYVGIHAEYISEGGRGQLWELLRMLGPHTRTPSVCSYGKVRLHAPSRCVCMNYECELKIGQHLEIDNEGEQTIVSFSSRATGQQQSQGHGFTTGKWARKPTVHRAGKTLIVRLETSGGARFLLIEDNQTTMLNSEPVLENAETVELKEAPERKRMKPMEPMRPMKPMEPMKPMN